MEKAFVDRACGVKGKAGRRALQDDRADLLQISLYAA